MMRILEALYNGNLLAEPVIENRSPEHQKAIDTAHRRVEALAEKLNAEEREMLDSVTEAMNEESDYFAAERFIRGYCLDVGGHGETGRISYPAAGELI